MQWDYIGNTVFITQICSGCNMIWHVAIGHKVLQSCGVQKSSSMFIHIESVVFITQDFSRMQLLCYNRNDCNGSGLKTEACINISFI
jgi:hypothetical protein